MLMPISKKRKEESNPHGISCSCARCIGLRRYPDAQMCDWCKTVHAGDANNCSEERADDTNSLDTGDDLSYLNDIVNEVIDKIKAITQHVKETMLPNADAEPKKGQRRSGAGMTYLTNEMLSRNPKEAKILACRLDPEGKFGARVILKLAMDGTIVYWGVNIKRNPSYRSLLSKFGPEENDWAAQRILLSLEKDEFSEQYFVHVSYPDPKKK